MTAISHYHRLAYLLLYLFLVQPGHADSGVMFYTYPEQWAERELGEWQKRTTPLRRWISLNGEWDLKHPVSGELLQPVNVPCSYQGASAFLFEKHFEIHKKRNESFRLHLGEINGDVVVTLNGEQLYQGTQSSLPVSLFIQPQLINNGENTLQVHLTPSHFRFSKKPGWLPLNLPKTNTGIIHGVFLEAFPETYIASRSFDKQTIDSLFTLKSSLTLNNFPRDGRGYSVEVSLRTADRVLASARVQLDSSGTRTIALPPLSLKLSSKAQQSIHAHLSLDTVQVPIDIYREFVTGNHLPLPGEPIDLLRNLTNGINYVYQSSEGSSVFDPKLARKDLEDIKARGFTTIRVILQPLPEPFYDICDDLGMQVFQDLPLIYLNQQENLLRTTLGEWHSYYRHLEALADRHPSIMAIGVSFYPDERVMIQKQLLDAFIKLIGPKKLPIYSSSILSPGATHSAVDFYIIELLERNDLDNFVHQVNEHLGTKPFMLSAFTYPYSYRRDKTELIFARRQQGELYRLLKNNAPSFKIGGHFIYTYVNFRLQMPLMQNGFEGQNDINWLGLVDLERKPLDTAYSGLDSELNLGIPDRSYQISEENASQSFIYILVGLFNLFVFLISYKRYRLFRQNLGYSIRKPHGFFVNLQERIIIPYRQSIFLLLAIALNGAIVYSAIAFYYRDNLIFDFLLSIVFYSPALKSFVIKTIWNQPQFLVIGTLLVIAIFHLLALVLKIVSIFSRGRVLFGQALAATIWAASPFSFLLVVPLFIYSPILLHMESYLLPLIVTLFFHLWFYLRWINGARVLMDWLYLRTFVFCTVFLIALAGGTLYLWQVYFQGWDYVEYAYNIYKAVHPYSPF